MPKETLHSPMTNAAWKQCIVGLLDGVERELHADAPTEDKDALQSMRSRLEKKRITEARKPFERKIDRLIESRPYLFAAAHRHIGKVLPPAVEQAASTMKRARDLLDRAPNKLGAGDAGLRHSVYSGSPGRRAREGVKKLAHARECVK